MALGNQSHSSMGYPVTGLGELMMSIELCIKSRKTIYSLRNFSTITNTKTQLEIRDLQKGISNEFKSDFQASSLCA